MYHISHKFVSRGMWTLHNNPKVIRVLTKKGCESTLNSNLLILGLLLEPREPPSSQLVLLLVVTAPSVFILRGRVHLLDDLRHVRLRLGRH